MAAVGTTTISRAAAGKRRKLIFDWVSDASGVVSGTPTASPVVGTIVQIITNPGAVAPTDNYDITLIGDEGQDVLNGAGVDRDTANTELVMPTAGIPVPNTTLELRIANAGATKAGRLIVVIDPG